MEIIEKTIRGIAYEYSKIVDNGVFKFLEKQGYEIERKPRAVKELQARLKSEGLTIEIKTNNQLLTKLKNDMFRYTFDLEISFKEV